MFASQPRGTPECCIGDVTMGVDHYAVQGALAVALVVLAVLAAVWPRGRRSLGIAVGLCAGYVGLVSFAFPGTLGRAQPALVGAVHRPGRWPWSSCPSARARSELGQLRGEVVEAQRAL